MATTVEPSINSILCMAWSAQRRRDALHIRTAAMLKQLCQAGEG